MDTPKNYPKFLTLAQAAAHPMMPRRANGKPFHVETVRRWTLSGSKGRILKSVMVGGIRCTTEAWIYEFNLGETPENRAAPYPRTRRQRRAIRAEREARKLLGLPIQIGGGK